MKLATRSSESPQLDLTPLIDVVFLLLMFFMVTTTFDRQTAVRIELPEAGEQAEQPAPDVLELLISDEGRYFVGANEIVVRDVGALSDALARLTDDPKSAPLVIRADARARHQDVVRAMDAAGRAGYQNLRIASTPVAP